MDLFPSVKPILLKSNNPDIHVNEGKQFPKVSQLLRFGI